MSNELLRDEISIKWLENPGRFRYLREAVVLTPSRNQSVQLGGSGRRLIGYGVLRSGVRGFGRPQRRWHRRRFWFVKDGDECGESLPAEAVDPRTVWPGVASKRPGEDSGGEPRGGVAWS